MPDDMSTIQKSVAYSVATLKSLAHVDDKPKRNQLLIAPRFQARFALMLVLVAGVSGIVGAVGFQGIIDLTGGPEARAPHIQAMRRVVGDLLVLALIGVPVAGIFISHRLVGPLLRIRTAMERTGRGEAGVTINLRPRDEFQDLAEAFNRMTARMEKRDQEEQQWIRKLRKRVTDVTGQLRQAGEDELPEILLRLEDLDARLDQRLGGQLGLPAAEPVQDSE